VTIELGEGGRLLKPGFHDGHLLGVELIGDHEAIVKLRKLSGGRYSLNLSGVERLLCNGFAEGNIVSEVYLVSGALPPVPSLCVLMPQPHASAKAHLVEQGELTFVAIEASYGCDLYALCRSAEITPHRT